MDFVISPGNSIGPIESGAIPSVALADVRAALGRPTDLLSNGVVTSADGIYIQVTVDAHGFVDSVEIYRSDLPDDVILDDVSLFRNPARRVVEFLTAKWRVDELEGGCRFEIPEIYLSLWRPVADDRDPGGEYFEAVLFAGSGYGNRSYESYGVVDPEPHGLNQVECHDEGDEQGTLF